MDLAELDKRAAQLVQEYQRLGQFAAVLRTYDEKGNCRVICPSVNRATLSAYLNSAAEMIFDGQNVRSTPAVRPD